MINAIKRFGNRLFFNRLPLRAAPSRDVVWTEETLARALNLDLTRGRRAPISITRVDVRSSRCSTGSLYIPEMLDGPASEPRAAREAREIQTAIELGAEAAVSSLDARSFAPSHRVLRVLNPTAALETLARAGRERFSGKVVAVTGSVGKTTTKDIIHHMLGHFGSSRATFKNECAVPELYATIASLPPRVDFATLEMGAFRPGRMAMRGPIARPDIAVVTNVGLSHLMRFHDPYEILREKVSLFDYLTSEGTAIVHESILQVDDARERLIRTKPLSRLVTIGFDKNADVHLVELTSNQATLQGVMSVFGAQHRFQLSIPAKHFAENAMFAAATAHVLDLKVADAIAAFATFIPSGSRMERWRVQFSTGVIELIDDSFNAAPKSVLALLDFLLDRETTCRKVLVLGDMRELGTEEARLHEELAPEVEQAGISLLITVGPLAQLVAAKVSAAIEVRSFDDAVSASEIVPALLQPWDLVAVKASRAVALEKVVGAITSSGITASPSPIGWRIEDELRGVLPRALFTPSELKTDGGCEGTPLTLSREPLEVLEQQRRPWGRAPRKKSHD